MRNYRLTTPCKPCPFRTDVTPYLRAERAAEIVQAIRDGGDFPCHKTTVLVEGEDGEEELARGPKSQQCAGSLILQQKEGAGQVTRIAERLGAFDPEALDMVAPVFDHYQDFIEAQHDYPHVVDDEGNRLPFEHCGVVGDDCEDPAGYSFTGANLDVGMCNPLTDFCSRCGNVGCPPCLTTVDGDTVCVICTPEDT